jgi:hypothetical protein
MIVGDIAHTEDAEDVASEDEHDFELEIKMRDFDHGRPPPYGCRMRCVNCCVTSNTSTKKAG